jgi:hypothetical protein
MTYLLNTKFVWIIFNLVFERPFHWDMFLYEGVKN